MIKKDSADFSAVKTNTQLMGDENFAYFSPSEQLKTMISNYTITFPVKGVISDDYTIVPHGSATLHMTGPICTARYSDRPPNHILLEKMRMHAA